MSDDGNRERGYYWRAGYCQFQCSECEFKCEIDMNKHEQHCSDKIINDEFKENDIFI